MSTIPASSIVSVIPSVLVAGGTGLNGIGLFLTTNSRVPLGTVQSFSSPLAVASYFGASSTFATEAEIYFTGFSGLTTTPSNLLIAQFNGTAVAAYLRGGNISALTLPQLQAINGTLDVAIDGYPHNGTVNLSSATSFSNAASLIQTALNGSLPTEANATASISAGAFQVTGSVSGLVLTVTAVASGIIVAGAALTGSGVTAGMTIANQLSGTSGGIGNYAILVNGLPAISDVASTTINGTYGTLSVSAVASGTLAVGQSIVGSGVTVGTVITGLAGGVGGTGAYYVNLTQTAGSGSITTGPVSAVVTFDSVSGGFIITSGIQGVASTAAFATGAAAASLLLTSATGAVVSQGGAGVTPSTFMTGLIVQNVAWVNYMTHFDPDGGNGNAQKQLFAAWKNTALGGNRFGYFCWDTDESPAASSDAATCLGQVLKANGDSGTLLIWEGGNPVGSPDNGLCAFALGLAAAINYEQTNGRTDFAFRAQAGLVANVTDGTTSGNLISNGYCFYGAYGAANANFIWFQNGQITGPYEWADSWQTQVWLNTFFQVQLLTLLQNSLSVPFTTAGASLISQTCQTVIQQALAFGAFAPNTLTPAQVAAVNQSAGMNIAGSLQSQGYYLQINIPSQIVQAARGPWDITFYYIDRNSVQSITLSSVLVQ